jgi:methionine synthase II (cobalamin-independent)
MNAIDYDVALPGVTGESDSRRYRVERETRPGVAVAGQLRPRRRLAAHEADFLARHARSPFKITLPSATLIGLTSCRTGITDTAYATPSALAYALAEIIRTEVQALIDEGVPYIQIDAPNYTSLVDPEQRERQRLTGRNLEQALSEAIAIDNASLAGVRRGGSGGDYPSVSGKLTQPLVGPGQL